VTPASEHTANAQAFGFATRLEIDGDAVSNTAAGPLVAHYAIRFENGSGFDTVNGSGYIDQA